MSIIVIVIIIIIIIIINIIIIVNIIIVSSITVFGGVLFVHQPGANHAPRTSFTQVNHAVHTLSTFLRIRADPSLQIFWTPVTVALSDTFLMFLMFYYYYYYYYYYYHYYYYYYHYYFHSEKLSIGHLHDDIILLLWPKSFSVFLSCTN